MSGRKDATLRERAVALLARREHSRQELITKLKARGFPTDAIVEVVDGLAAEGLQSDPRFTETYVHYRVARGYGPERIRQELRQRGISGEQVEEQLAAAAIDWLEEAARAREKKYGTALPADYREKTRQARFLQSRGFSGDQIARIFRSDD